MKLLLDEMWSPVLAEQLRERGYDVQAVAERSDLRTMLDPVVFGIALSEGRVIVTEDIAGYRSRGENELLSGRSHPGLVFTSPATFPRRDTRTQGRLVRALASLLDSGMELRDREVWLTAD